MDEACSFKQLREKIRKLERELGALDDCQFNCCGFTIAQCHALVEIGRSENISLNRLADLLNLNNSTMSRRVDDLVNSKLVKREYEQHDRRSITISLTEAGKNICTDIEENMDLYFKRVFDAIPENKRYDVLESVQILLEAICKINSNN